MPKMEAAEWIDVQWPWDLSLRKAEDPLVLWNEGDPSERDHEEGCTWFSGHIQHPERSVADIRVTKLRD